MAISFVVPSLAGHGHDGSVSHHDVTGPQLLPRSFVQASKVLFGFANPSLVEADDFTSLVVLKGSESNDDVDHCRRHSALLAALNRVLR